jgi:hypothetical protein
MNKNIPEYIGIKNAVDGRINAGLSDRIGILVIATAATTVTLSQHTAASGGSSKDLNTDNISYQKANGASVFTKTKPDAGVVDNEYAIAAAGIFYIEVESSQLDTNGGYSYVSAAGSTTTILYMAVDARKGPAYDVAL